MFATLPKNKKILDLKEDLLSSMEDKYNELKRNGKSENEAIGIVISEFGNIDELIKEFDIELDDQSEELPMLTENEVNDYLEVNKKASKLIGLGVTFCILGAALLILITQLIGDGLITGVSDNYAGIVGLIPLLLLVAVAVGLFIYSGMTTDRFKYIENDFELPSHLRQSIKNKSNSYDPTYTKAIIIGVVLCIVSPIFLFITAPMSESASSYGVVVLLMIVSVAVNIFIYFGMKKESYKKLLKIDEYTHSNKQKNKVIGAIGSIVWPLAVIIFLVSGLVFNQWHINWIVFPITGLLFAMFSGAYSILKEKN
nr:permease prefix domain 1-containing protein [Aquibacillus halophilus]